MTRDVTYTFHATDQAGHETVVTHTVTVSDPTSSWPSAATTGPRQSPTKTLNGASITDTSWFAANGFTGAGTQANPYVVSRVLFTSTVTLGDWNSTNIGGKYVKFVDCRFYGAPSNPTSGGSSYVNVRDTGPFVTLEYCHLGPNATPLTSGGPPSSTGGTDKGVQSYVPITVRRCNIWGACILVYMEIERSEAASLIEENYLHDIWSSTGDHTDIINGNFHASHVTCRGNYMDGIRTGNSVVTNGFGIYDDPGTSAGIIEDWTIDGNYVKRCATGLLCTTSTSRFLNPFVVRNNTWAGPFSVTRFAGRTPSNQSGNVDGNGNSITL